MVCIALVPASAALKSPPMDMLMDINKMHAARMAEVIYHWCSQKGHYKQDCPFHHDLCFMDNKEKDEFAMQLLAQQDTLAAESQATASNDSDTYVRAASEAVPQGMEEYANESCIAIALSKPIDEDVPLAFLETKLATDWTSVESGPETLGHWE
ncbi:hypothetical protein DXG03_006762 [Asterophora parasitica]|uniref:Uncharacterized protein n=1 Tax=Asterophora parasitica TaxID=117018 RepID=A0A9P7G5H7_9AGAR|nr:hypothetical protein DXG03_006762 [Asterophora parasitica]